MHAAAQTPRAAVALLAAALAATACDAGPAPSRGIFAGQVPPELGLHDGRLAGCPPRPNCVSSLASDGEHRVAPLPMAGDATAAMLRVAEMVRGETGASVITQRLDYLHAEFTSAVFGFVDDVEFHAGHGRIDVRSASRLGYYDFGVNRRRVEHLRGALDAPNTEGRTR
jgi:uncharacterized protein (DUF1499 family)